MSVDEVVQSGATRVPPLHVVGDCSYCSCSMVTDLVQWEDVTVEGCDSGRM